MTTAMDDWAARNGEADVEGGGDKHVHEGDITGAQVERSDDESGYAAVDEAEAAAVDEAHALKKRKDKRTMMIAGGVLFAIIGGVGALKVLAPSPAPLASVVEAPQEQSAAPVAQEQPMVAAVPASAPAVAVVDFGLQAPVPPVMEVASSPALGQPVVAAAVAPVGEVQVGAQEGSAVPVLESAVTALVPAAAAAPIPPAPMAMAAPLEAAKPVVSTVQSDAELQELRELSKSNSATIAQLSQELGELKVAIKTLKSAPRPAAAPRRPAPAVKAVAAADKPFVGITEQKGEGKPFDPDKYAPIPPTALNEPKATPSAPAASVKGGRVRGDFTVYAISNGRAWVHWSGDGENHMVGPNSVLPDNSRVSSIDDVKGVVLTSGGEIHAKPAK